MPLPVRNGVSAAFPSTRALPTLLAGARATDVPASARYRPLRRSDPKLAPEEWQKPVEQLMNARRQVGAALKAYEAETVGAAPQNFATRLRRVAGQP